MKKNILVIGEALDLYRTQTFVKCVLDKYSKYNLTYIGVKSTLKPEGNLFSICIGKFRRKVDWILRELFTIYQMCFADAIYIPAMYMNFRLLNLAHFLKKKIIAEYYISMYDTLVLDRKTYDKNDHQAVEFKRYDTLLQKYSHVIYLNRTEAERYSALSDLNLNDLDFSIIPLCVAERGKAKLTYYKEKAGRFNIMWWGTYIPLHGLDKLFEAFKVLCDIDTDMHFFILGNNEIQAASYYRFIEDHNLQGRITIRNDITFGNGKLEEYIIEHGSLALGVFGDSEKARSVIVNKAIEAMGMKIPVLTQHSSAFGEYFVNEESIFMCSAEVNEVVKSIIHIKSMSCDKIEKVVDNAYSVFTDNFSVSASYYAYNRLLNSNVECLP